MLQVGIDRDRRLPGGVRQAAGQCDVLAEIARQAEQAQTRIAGAALDEPVPAVVAAAVIDADDFRCNVEAIQHRIEAGEKRVDIGAFVEDRDDDRQPGSVAPLVRARLAGPDVPALVHARFPSRIFGYPPPTPP
jgi:hypothetical protein